MMSGYDVELIKSVVNAVSIPVVALGGAGDIQHFKTTLENCQVSGLAAGSMFVFHGTNKAVLIKHA